ncbi:MAG: hypothetical protein ABFC77_07360 [Thermoguttaceae bacterium]
MRLTLRTLLAYLDGILEPQDAQDIAKKIEESPYASNLVEHIRDVMQRLRLGAPSLTDRNAKLDANAVAEYLDNTLSSDDVSDFEKICLDSDIHLAEVAACHQILTLVLGEPADIDPVSRQRMYQQKDRLEGSVPTPPPPPPPPPIGSVSTLVPPQLDLGESDVNGQRVRPMVPEYLRESQRRRHWLSTAIGAALVLGFVVVGLLVTPGKPLSKWFGRKEAAVSVKTTSAKAAPSASSTDESAQPSAAEPSGVAASESAPSSVKPDEKPSERTSVAGQPETPPQSPQTEKHPTAQPSQEPTTVKSSREKEPATKVTPDHSTAEIKIKPTPEPAVKDRQEPSKDSEAKPGQVVESPLPVEPLARMMSTDQVLLREDAKNGWTRVEPNEALMPQQLEVLPTYRVKLALTSGVTLEILGGTRLELLPARAKDPPGIRVVYGRVVMMPLARSDTQLRVEFGKRVGVLTFSDTQAVAAIDVRRRVPPGLDPTEDTLPMTADLYASSGNLVWHESEPEEKSLVLKAPRWVGFDANQTSEPMTKESPKWITTDPISLLDRKASLAIASPALWPTDQSARVALSELSSASRPQKEVRWLALRCLAFIDQFQEMAMVLNDPAYRLDWSDYVDELRQAVTRSAESAKAVKHTLEKHYPQQASKLFRMLCNYSNDDLAAGEDVKLVDALNDEVLAVRVLSYWNLKDLTGVGGGLYRPDQTQAKRQQPMRRWQERLKDGKIRVKETESTTGPAETKASATGKRSP